MSQLYFNYGTMNCGKTLQLLAVAHNYESSGRNILILKPSLDTRSNDNEVNSRTGMSHKAITIHKNDDILSVITIENTKIKEKWLSDKISNNRNKLDCILIDEAQFLTAQQVADLTFIVDDYNIPVICYGLKSAYNGELFEGSKELLIYASKITEIKTICADCGNKAIMNLRIHNGKPIYYGDSVKVGDINEGEDYYKPVCRYHYFHPIIKEK